MNQKFVKDRCKKKKSYKNVKALGLDTWSSN